MLQAINVKPRARRASSLYCVWTKRTDGEGARLVAIWVDREMRAFTGQFGSVIESKTSEPDNVESAKEPPPGTSELLLTIEEGR